MARPCLVCTSLDKDAIDLALSGGNTLSAISERYGVSTDALRRHKTAHLTPALVALARQRRNEVTAVTVHERLEQLVVQANRLLAKAERKGSLMPASQLVGQIRQVLEIIGKLTGEIDDRPVTQVINIATSPDWLTVRQAILQALDRYPEARMAVISALARPELEAS